MRGVLALLAVLALAPAAGAAPRPALQILEPSPLVLRGVGFRAHERVQIVVATPARRAVAHVLAGAAGRFVVRPPGVTMNECAGVSIVATGSLGSRATVKRAPGQCPLP